MTMFIMILLVSLMATSVKSSPINPQLLKSMVGAKTTETVPYLGETLFTTPKVLTFDITLVQVSQDEENNATKAGGDVPESSSKVKDSFNRQEDAKVEDNIQKRGQSDFRSSKTGIEDEGNASLHDESDNLEETGSTAKGGKVEMVKCKIC